TWLKSSPTRCPTSLLSRCRTTLISEGPEERRFSLHLEASAGHPHIVERALEPHLAHDHSVYRAAGHDWQNRAVRAGRHIAESIPFPQSADPPQLVLGRWS